MATQWTDGQLKAIELRNRDILVAAAAGSGKTAVLVERIIRMISEGEKPLDIDRLLVVTFTNAAAAQMKERIGAALEKRLNDEPENVHLQRQLTLLNHAKITTIHSFCLYLVRNYFDRLDIDPDFRIADEGEIKLLRADVMQKLLEESFENAEPDFVEFVESYAAGRDDNVLEEYLDRLDTFAGGYPFPEEQLMLWQEELSKTEPEQFMDTEWMKRLMTDVSLQAREVLAEYEEAKRLCLDSDGPDFFLPMIESDMQIAVRLSEAADYNEVNEILGGMSFVRKPAKRKTECDIAKKERVSALRDRCKDALNELKKMYCVSDIKELSFLLKQSEAPLKALLKLAVEFGRRYAEAKKEKNIVDFGDLEHFALKILIDKGENSYAPSDAADAVSKMFDEILVDEYQDSNRVQELILKSVSKERFNMPNIFMVGDVKQSIYKFRLARPELFIEKYNTYTDDDSSYQKIDLHMNFRSRSEVLDSVNYLFDQIMTKKLGNIEYDEAARLNAKASYPLHDGSLNTELMIVDVSDEAVELLDDENDYQSKELEAFAIAKRIKELTDKDNGFMVYDKDTDSMRMAQYSDIVILLRSFTGWAEVFVNTLAENGIPAFAESQTGYFDTLEVRTVLDLLNVIDNPIQDIPLASVLKSPVGALSDIELARIVAEYKSRPEESAAKLMSVDFAEADLQNADEGGYFNNVESAQTDEGYCFTDDESVQKAEAGCCVNDEERAKLQKEAFDISKFEYEGSGLYGACLYYMKHGSDSGIAGKLERFFAMREEFAKMALYMSLDDLIRTILQKSGYGSAASVMPGGRVREANLEMLIQKAAEFETTSYHGLFNFIRYIENLKKYSVDFGEASVIGENDNIVRLTTIHKSKGLEYPIVIAAGMGKKFNMQDSRARILLEPDLGIAADSINLDKRVRTATLAKKVFKRQINLSSLGEELRILYVAMTRAKEKLILTGCDKNVQGIIKKWQSIAVLNDLQIPYTYLSNASSYLDWLIMGLMRHPSMQNILRDYNMDAADICALTGAGFDIKIISPSDIIVTAVGEDIITLGKKEELINWNDSIVYDAEAAEKINELLSYKYHKADELDMHMKMSVSELKRRGAGIEDEDESVKASWLRLTDSRRGTSQAESKPHDEMIPETEVGSKSQKELAFENKVVSELQKEAVLEDRVDSKLQKEAKTGNIVEDKPRKVPEFAAESVAADGALKGTAMHKFMELIDFKMLLNPGIDVKGFVLGQKEKFIEEGRISHEFYESIDERKAVSFLKSPLARRMAAAAGVGRLYKEKQFVMGVPAHRIGGEYHGDELILVQGIIDAYFEENGELVVVDYKTDAVKSADELISRYKAQLDYYKLALEQITGKKVRDKIIYSFKLNKEIRIP
ncbi:MAG: UvrD-helicase domain-containing protein [Lachnospiraceae bacterium]|nr:UvrD-helicase domain-containing protein [Lachnospiraceae bacterium]